MKSVVFRLVGVVEHDGLVCPLCYVNTVTTHECVAVGTVIIFRDVT